MPVDFNRVPPRVAVPPPHQISMIVWTVLLALVMGAGAGLPIMLWPAGRPTNTLWFWFCVVGYPSLVWAFGLFAWFGFRIFAAKGKVQIQAQSDAMELMSMQDMTASSSDGEVVITGRKGVTLGDGAGAYVKLSGGKIILGSPAGEIEVKGNLTIDDADGGNFKFPAWSQAPLNDVKKVMNFGFSE